MEPYFSYDEMLEERITSDRQVRVACETLLAKLVVTWNRRKRWPHGGGLRRESQDARDRRRKRPRG